MTDYSMEPMDGLTLLRALRDLKDGTVRMTPVIMVTGHADPAQAPRHPACGTPVEARWYCPTCDHLVDDEPDQAEVHFV